MRRALYLLIILVVVACRQQPASVGDPGKPPVDAPTVATTTATSAAAQETSAPATTPVPAIAAGLAGLPIDDFFEASFRMLLLRDPELVTQAGLSDIFGVSNDRLTDLSDAYIRETQALETAILDLLRGYDRAALAPEQQFSYDIYEWYLADLVAGHAFTYDDYPVNHIVTSIHYDTIQLFTDIHPVRDRQDVEDYIARLSQVERKFDQLIDGLRLREEQGVILPRFALEWTLPGVRQIANNVARNTPFYTSLDMKLKVLSSIDPPTQSDLLVQAEQAIEQSVIPAFQALADYLAYQLTIATNDDGVWKFPNGASFYDYALRHHSTTAMTADEIHALGLSEVERIQAEMRVVFAELGYPADESLPDLIRRVVQDSGTLAGDDIVAGYEALIADALSRTAEAFDLLPKADVIVIGVPRGGYYVRPAVDGSRPGAFYATAQGEEEKYGMATLAYHEAVPGHHFQLAIQQELTGLPSFRSGVSFNAFTEGWALYAEQLAYELGFYEGDPYGNIGRLQGELFRAVRLVVDTGIHAKRWTFAQAVGYMIENTGYPRDMVEAEISRYIVWPGQAVSYMIGMREILALREQAQAALGDAFDLRAFHNALLQSGNVPLLILVRVVETYIAEAQRP